MVSNYSIIFMALSAAVSIGLPVVLFLALRKRLGMKLVPMLVGAAGFFIFALVLEQIMHMLVLRPSADGSIALAKENPALYILYGIFAAGIFEETARLLGFLLLKKKYSGVGTGLSHGIGHGGIEAVMIAGISMISTIALSLMLNSGALSAELLGTLPESTISQLTDTAPIMFLVSGIERIFAISIQISLSVIVWCCVNAKSKSGGKSLWYLFPAAILLHALVDLVAAMFQVGIFTNVWLVEGVVAAFAVILPVIAWLVYRNAAHNDTATAE